MNKEKIKKSKPPKPTYNMAQNSWYMIKLAWTLEEKKVLVCVLLSAILSVASNLVNLYISPTILLAVERHVSMTELLLTIAGFVFAMMFVQAATSYLQANELFGRVSVRCALMGYFNRKAATTSYSNLSDDDYLSLLEKAMQCVNSNDKATEAIWDTLTSLMINLLGFLIYVSLLSSVQPILILVVLVTSLMSYFIHNYVNRYEYQHRDEAAEYQRHMNYISYCAQDLSIGKDIRIFGLRPWLQDLHRQALDAYIAFQSRAQGVYILGKIADLVLTFLRNAIAYAYLIGLVVQNSMGVAQFLLYFSAVGGFTTWVSGILSGFNRLYKQSLDICVVREYLDYHEPFKFDEGEQIEAKEEKAYELKLENVSYRYQGADKDTLTNINLTLHHGEKLAIVGLNGAGKTTLIKLLCGFLDPTEGRVLLNGKDIRDFNRADYYTMFSAVFQSFSLLAGTIAMNIAQTVTDIDMERVMECAQKAGLGKKIESLPDGYETYLNRQIYEDAIMLSGGETQRLMLARALYKNAPFIILDEPTAALDPIAESDMYQKYNEMTSGKSSVYISHRLASTRFCDRILMLDDAGIAEEGTHEELLKSGGKYAELYEVQSKYYKEGVVDDGEK